MTDLTYTKQGLFTTFIPETKAGESAWNEIAKHNDGVAKVFTIHLDSTLKTLRKAGYSVKAAKPKKLEIDEEELLSELMK